MRLARGLRDALAFKAGRHVAAGLVLLAAIAYPPRPIPTTHPRRHPPQPGPRRQPNPAPPYPSPAPCCPALPRPPRLPCPPLPVSPRVRIGEGLVWQDHPTEIRRVLAEVDRQLSPRPTRSQLADIGVRYDRYCARGMKRPTALRLATNRVLGVA